MRSEERIRELEERADDATRRLNGLQPEVVEIIPAKITGGSGGMHAWTRQRIDATGGRYDDPLTFTGQVSGVSAMTATWQPARMPDGSTLSGFPIQGFVKPIGLTPSTGPNFEVIGAASSGTSAVFSGAFVYLSANTTASHAVVKNLSFDVEVYDTDSYHSSTNHYFTVPANGKYDFGAKTMVLASSPHNSYVRLYAIIERGASSLHTVGDVLYAPWIDVVDINGNPTDASLPICPKFNMTTDLQTGDLVGFRLEYLVCDAGNIGNTVTIFGDSFSTYDTHAWITKLD